MHVACLKCAHASMRAFDPATMVHQPGKYSTITTYRVVMSLRQHRRPDGNPTNGASAMPN